MEEKIEKVLEFLETSKCKDLSVYDISKDNSLAKFIIIANFNDAASNKEFASKFASSLNLEVEPEGYNNGEWIIFDLNEIIIHTFIPSKRDKYNLDKMWQNFKVNLAKDKKPKK